MPRILLVEDEEIVRYALRELLVDAGCDVVEASDGKDAVVQMDRQDVDLVVTDIFMPEMDGLELIRHIRNTRPELRVIAISGGGARQNPDYATKLAVQMGADQTMHKPVDSGIFLDQISQLT